MNARKIFIIAMMLGYTNTFAETAIENNSTATSIISSSDVNTTNEINTNIGNTASFEEEFGDVNKTAVFDPFSGYNKFMTNVNDKFYKNIADPIATGYAKILPEKARVSVNNLIHHLRFPIRLANNLLQFKIKNSAEETGRFVVNTIFGLGGLFDPAKTDLGWERHDEDLGQTLGFYGLPDGPYIVLPILGSSNLRDTVGLVGDTYISPLYSADADNICYKIPQNTYQDVLIGSVEVINKTSLHLGEYDLIKKDALDLYSFLRDAYTQQRRQKIKE
ncbi:MAG: VacJ family lipoprotein [Sulfurovaceae bacterium]|nr:VacJ family lipoprotein [Sulfurovaceae bacterium]